VLATVVITEAVWRLPPRVAVLGFLILPVLALPLWVARASDASTFTFVKIYSVALGAAYVHALKITTWVERPWGRLVAFVLLAGNILEASVAELAQGGYANAFAGLLLILVQASPATFRVEPRGPGKDLVYPLGGLWVAGYSLWNFTFLYGRDSHGKIGVFAGLAVIHLLGPLLAMRGRSDLFIQSRAIGLMFVLALRMSLPYPPFLYLSTGWYIPAVATVLRVASLALAVALVVQSVARARLGGRAGNGLEHLVLALGLRPAR
jgi:hypothetical protein